MAKSFKTIGIIGKHNNPHAGGILNELIEYLDRNQIDILLDERSLESITELAERNSFVSRSILGTRCDLVIVVGGDGTLLNAARSLVDFDVPILGINLGRLGFLTDITPSDLTDTLDQICAGNYQEEKRDLLQARVLRDGNQINESTAFNDVVVHTCSVARMIEYDVHIDGKHVNTTRSDGMIVSTPTGSTAYALSGGGPILHPSLSALVLVPICPHTMSYRPIVVDGNSVIEIIVSKNNQARAQCSCDGQIDLSLQNGDHVIIERKPLPIKLIHPADYNYYGILRAKLHWGKRL
ncbi:MAG: NAD(+) kinase [Ectothiorhodospiraceae bacterium]|nr:NAD(+) kinase [Ectothiorhodospiraceae bacterium]